MMKLESWRYPPVNTVWS